jgi:hypothetical protein
MTGKEQPGGGLVPVAFGPPGDLRLWAQCANKLAERIADGTYKRGEWLPSTRDIAIELGMSITPVLRALPGLCGKGLVSRVQGVGYYVGNGGPPPAPSAITGFDEWAPPLPLAAGFPAAADRVTTARHERLDAEFMTSVARGDTRAAGMWLRRAARDPGVSPWLLLDLLAARDVGAAGTRSLLPARSRASLGHRGERTVQAGGAP